jgi:rhodanese-related sulfurtransferase
MTTPSQSLPFELSPAEVAGLVADGAIQLVDVREPSEWEAGRVAGARHVPLAELTAAAASIDPSVPVVFVCRVGARSSMAAWSFARAGFDSHNLTGGVLAWVASGLPFEGFVADH